MNNVQRILLEKRNCNVVAIAGSVLQLCSVNAAIRYLCEQGLSVVGYVFYDQSIEDSYMECSYDNVVYIKKPVYINTFYEHLKEEYYAMFATDVGLNPIYMIASFPDYSMHYNIKKTVGRKRRIIWIEIDDGMANYMHLFTHRLVRECLDIRKDRIMPVKFVRALMKTSKILLYEFFNKSNHKQLTIFTQKKRWIVPNLEVVRFFKASLRNIGKNIVYEDIGMLERCVLIIGKIEDNWEFLRKINEILKEKGEIVFYKPHPRSQRAYIDLKNTNCNLFINNEWALEAILEKLKIKPKIIIGSMSSCLIYSTLLFGIPAVCIDDIEGQICCNYVKYIVNDLRGKFDRYIYFPKTIIELVGIIDKSCLYTSISTPFSNS